MNKLQQLMELERSNNGLEVKKRPLSPINGSRVLQWKSADGPLSVKGGWCHGQDGESAILLDIAPVSSSLDSVELHFRENLESPIDCELAEDKENDFKENTLDSRTSLGLDLENCTQRSHENGGHLTRLPSKWKKDTKAELHRMIEEQEKTWKIAEDAVEELGRRLELLEIYKMEIQGTLQRTRTIDGIFNRLQNLGDCPKGFTSLYNSSLYEEGMSFHKCSTCRDVRTSVRTSSTRPDSSKDSEIKKLKIEVVHLRAELQQRDSKRLDCQNLKLSPGAPSSPVESTHWSCHVLSGSETALKQECISSLLPISLRGPTTPEVILEEMEPELADLFEEKKTINIPASQNASKQYPNGKVDRFERSGFFASRTVELDVDNRGCVPIPEKNCDDSATPLLMENGIGQMDRIDHQERNTPQENIYLSVDLNFDEGELRVLKMAVKKLSRLFWEQEEKLESFKQTQKKEEANNYPAEDVQRLYFDILKEMSQQLGEFRHIHHAKTQLDEALLKQERTIHKCSPLRRLVQEFQSVETMDMPAATIKDVEIAQQLDDTSQLPTNKMECRARQSLKGEECRPENITADAESLTTALEAAEKKMEEQIKTNVFLTEKLESGSQYLSKMKAEHAQEVARKDHSINYAKKLNFGLSNDMSQTEASLAATRLRYKSLVLTLERQLEEVRKEALSLQDAVNILKDEIVRKENLVSNLEEEAKEHKLQIEQLRSELEAIHNDTSENGQEKLDLLDTLEALRREVAEQQHCVTALISINEDLIGFSETKEVEIMALESTIKGLEQCIDEKSGETAKLTAESLAFSQDVVDARKEEDTYRLRCIVLKSKLETLELELQAREPSMEAPTQHLGNTIESQHFTPGETKQLLLSLNMRQYKEHRLDDQVRQSNIIIQDLEEILNSMDAEINEARLGMATMKTKGLEALLVE